MTANALTTWTRELVTRRDLLYTIAWREIKIKYKQSVMGIMWAILMPMLIISAGIVVRSAIAMVSGEDLAIGDMASVAVRAAPWAFFISSIRFGTASLITNAALVTKIYMPREIFPIGSVMSQFVDFLVASVTVTIFLTIAQIGVSVQLLWIPVLVAVLVLLAVTCATALSAAALFFRDVKYLVEVFVTFAIFFTPVFYEVEMFGDWAPLMLINPVAPLLEGLSAVIVDHQPPPMPWIAYSAVFSILGLMVAITFFKRVEPYFAESV